MNGAIETMVERQVAARGVRDEQVLRAFRAVPRQMFASEEMAELPTRTRRRRSGKSRRSPNPSWWHAAGPEAFLLPLRYGGETLREQLGEARLQRAIGVIYRPRTERASHYFQAILPAQFDEYIWFGTTRAVRPLETKELEGVPETYPFGV
ncbi:MAG: hypothetical protein TEF_18660 [Rhizobiales bacterium NRL2]|jgi:hypothetical protein|nr:MAG: hypothetical protein TEF_18660 [Rhizobiales bacterium NRL2]